MTTTKQQKVRLGIFAVATGVLLVIVLAVFGGLRFWKARDRYYVEFETSVYGLEQGADVFFNGIRVGKVGDISISRTDIRKVRVALDIDEGTPVRTDTKAMLQLAGITGLKVIDLRDGTLGAPKLAAGATIPAGATMFDKLEEKGMAIIDQSQRLVERANTIVEKTDSIVTNLAEATDTTQLSAIVEQTRATAANLAQASASLKGLVDENRAGLRASIAAIEMTARRAADLVDGNQVKAAVSDLRQASRSFKELAREVRQRPSRLLYSSPAADRKLP